MTVKDVERALLNIKDNQNDSERAHVLEDEMWHSVLIAVARGSKKAKELAKAALRSEKIEFRRWYA